ncbi:MULTISPECIES: hypothetical protein [unclassified Streptomyces]|uniref:hypothetical protein n=1 Tax=unclassified Streptomyces TaxID=2593676 RepID=UPI0033D6CACC
MGALRRIRHRSAYRSPSRPVRARRLGIAAALATAAALGITACDPVDGGMNTSAVAFTTDQVATRALERQHTGVAWLSCTGRFDGKVTPGNQKSARGTAIRVDCQGETDNGKKITLKGKVRSLVDGDCVRGDLRAWIDGKQWFRVGVLGNCAEGDGDNGGGGGTEPSQPAPPRPTLTHRPPPSHEQPRPVPTTTVTVTVTADPPSKPTCPCTPGK